MMEDVGSPVGLGRSPTVWQIIMCIDNHGIATYVGAWMTHAFFVLHIKKSHLPNKILVSAYANIWPVLARGIYVQALEVIAMMVLYLLIAMTCGLMAPMSDNAKSHGCIVTW